MQPIFKCLLPAGADLVAENTKGFFAEAVLAVDVGFAAEAVDSLDGVFEAAPPKLKLASFKFTLAPVKPVAPVLGDRLKSTQIFSCIKVIYHYSKKIWSDSSFLTWHPVALFWPWILTAQQRWSSCRRQRWVASWGPV